MHFGVKSKTDFANRTGILMKGEIFAVDMATLLKKAALVEVYKRLNGKLLEVAGAKKEFLSVI